MGLVNQMRNRIVRLGVVWSAVGLFFSLIVVRADAENDRGADQLVNPGFEQGLLGWDAQGSAFLSQPVVGENVLAGRTLDLPVGGDYWSGTVFPIGVRGQRWIGTAEDRPDARDLRGQMQGDEPTGTLTSRPFTLQMPYLTFLVSGGRDPFRLRVDLISVGNSPDQDFVVRSVTGHDSDRFRREVWDLQGEVGRRFKLRVVDQSSGAWGHINFDDVRQEAFISSEGAEAAVTPYGPELPGAWVDSDSPVWGFSDLHTHPMAHLAFGGKLLHGEPDGDIEKALGNCKCTHGGWSVANPCGNTVRMFVVSQADSEFVNRRGGLILDHNHAGYPYFRTWPHFTTVTHQLMWHEWLRRAWQGGLRVMVGLAVNSHLLADGLDGALPHDDRASAEIQLQGMREFAARHSDFIEIAYSPSELRRIVRSGKLALILGMEVDNIGNFNFANVDKSPEAVRSEIRRLHAEGVRYMVPIHLTDNAFGGAAITGDLFNLSLRFNQSQPLSSKPDEWVPGPGFEIESAPDERIRFHLKPPMEAKTMETFRIILKLIEGFPFPWPGNPDSTLGGMFRREHEYEVVKKFFLSPLSIPEIPGGHRNRKGLSDLGITALDEMMKLGMMIDVDHMSERSVRDAMEFAKASSPRGYPLNSGHDYVREIAVNVASENSRTDEQLDHLKRSGGLIGLEYEFFPQQARGVATSEVLSGSSNIHSHVEPDCGGSSKAFAQQYLYAVDKVGAVSFGTDVNGMVKGPGPRFGPYSHIMNNYCPPELQKNPVRYEQSPGVRSWSGVNHPLVPLRTGKRIWDINVDGVSHYGLIPDFLQDMKNVGVVDQDFDPLFSGAENFARTWTRSIQESESMRTGEAPQNIF